MNGINVSYENGWQTELAQNHIQLQDLVSVVLHLKALPLVI